MLMPASPKVSMNAESIATSRPKASVPTYQDIQTHMNMRNSQYVGFEEDHPVPPVHTHLGIGAKNRIHRRSLESLADSSSEMVSPSPGRSPAATPDQLVTLDPKQSLTMFDLVHEDGRKVAFRDPQYGGVEYSNSTELRRQIDSGNAPWQTMELAAWSWARCFQDHELSRLLASLQVHPNVSKTISPADASDARGAKSPSSPPPPTPPPTRRAPERRSPFAARASLFQDRPQRPRRPSDRQAQAPSSARTPSRTPLSSMDFTPSGAPRAGSGRFTGPTQPPTRKPRSPIINRAASSQDQPPADVRGTSSSRARALPPAVLSGDCVGTAATTADSTHTKTGPVKDSKEDLVGRDKLTASTVASTLEVEGMGPGDTEISGYTARKTKPKELCDSEPSPLQDPASCNSLSSAQAPPQAAIMEEGPLSRGLDKKALPSGKVCSQTFPGSMDNQNNPDLDRFKQLLVHLPPDWVQIGQNCYDLVLAGEVPCSEAANQLEEIFSLGECSPLDWRPDFSTRPESRRVLAMAGGGRSCFAIRHRHSNSNSNTVATAENRAGAPGASYPTKGMIVAKTPSLHGDARAGEGAAFQATTCEPIRAVPSEESFTNTEWCSLQDEASLLRCNLQDSYKQACKVLPETSLDSLLSAEASASAISTDHTPPRRRLELSHIETAALASQGNHVKPRISTQSVSLETSSEESDTGTQLETEPPVPPPTRYRDSLQNRMLEDRASPSSTLMRSACRPSAASHTSVDERAVPLLQLARRSGRKCSTASSSHQRVVNSPYPAGTRDEDVEPEDPPANLVTPVTRSTMSYLQSRAYNLRSLAPSSRASSSLASPARSEPVSERAAMSYASSSNSSSQVSLGTLLRAQQSQQYPARDAMDVSAGASPRKGMSTSELEIALFGTCRTMRQRSADQSHRAASAVPAGGRRSAMNFPPGSAWHSPMQPSFEQNRPWTAGHSSYGQVSRRYTKEISILFKPFSNQRLSNMQKTHPAFTRERILRRAQSAAPGKASIANKQEGIHDSSAVYHQHSIGEGWSTYKRIYPSLTPEILNDLPRNTSRISSAHTRPPVLHQKRPGTR